MHGCVMRLHDMEITMKRELIAAILTVLLGSTPVFAQVGGIGSPTPGMGLTSPLGMAPGLPVPPAGIPLGATELASPGISPVPSGMTGMTESDPSCSSVGTSSSGSYDGGGIAVGAGMSMSGTCGTDTGSSAASTIAAPTTSPGGASKAGIPLGSVEIGNAGTSPLVAAPTSP